MLIKIKEMIFNFLPYLYMKSIFLHYIDTIADNIFKNENKTFINVLFFSFVIITIYKLINNKKNA